MRFDWSLITSFLGAVLHRESINVALLVTIFTIILTDFHQFLRTNLVKHILNDHLNFIISKRCRYNMAKYAKYGGDSFSQYYSHALVDFFRTFVFSASVIKLNWLVVEHKGQMSRLHSVVTFRPGSVRVYFLCNVITHIRHIDVAGVITNIMSGRYAKIAEVFLVTFILLQRQHRRLQPTYSKSMATAKTSFINEASSTSRFPCCNIKLVIYR